MMNKGLLILLIFLMVILIAITGALLYWTVLKGEILKPAVEGEVTPTPTLTQPTPTGTPTLTPTPTIEEKSALEQIREAFAAKYGKPLADVNASISENDGTYAKGGVSFAGEIAGAWFLAYKGTSGWIIVADGNGTVTCASIDPYNFPTTMVPECWDESTSTLITR
jgi:hypothetical protein